MEETEVWYHIIQILQTLVCLHANDIVHEDIKPKNIIY